MEQIREQPRQEQRQRMSYDEFLAAAENAHAEWVDGKALFFMPPTEAHQEMVIFLITLLRLFLRRFPLGKVLVAPFEMRLAGQSSSREPDILVVTNEHRDRLTGKRLIGPANMVFEIISDESVARDRGEKFYEYQAAGVREYWIVDPRPGLERIDLWTLDSAGRYQPVPADDGRLYRSTVLPGFYLDAAWLPNVTDLNERALIDTMTKASRS